jgi:EmrB/QacA subfamily drug resistance transporter
MFRGRGESERVKTGIDQTTAHERRWWALGVLCFSLIVITLDNTILNVAIPTVQRDLHATNSQLQWMVDSYTLVFAGLLLTAGSLGDRFGRRGALQLGLAVFGIGSILSAVAGTSNQLIATRALMGVGGAFIMPSTLSILTNVFTDPAERGRAIGVWAGIAGVGIALGPLAGGFLVEHFYWGSIFLVNVPIVVIAIVAGALLVPTSRDPAAPRLDLVGAGLSIAGLCALLYAIIEAPSDGWGAPLIVAGFAVAAVLLAAFIAWEAHSDHPMLDVRFFRNPRFTAASSGISLVFFALFGSTFLLTQYFQFVLGYGPLETGVRLLPYAGVLMVVSPLSARLVERVGTKIVVTGGLTLVAIGLLLFTTMRVDTGYGDIIWRMMLMAAGMGCTMAPATESIMGSLPRAKAGVGSAVNDTTRQVGGALGVAVIGSVLASVYGSKVGDAIAQQSRPVPKPIADAIKSQLGAALEVANRIGGPIGEQIASTAKHAFVGGLHQGVLVGALAAVVGAIVSLVWLPAHAREDVDLAMEESVAVEATVSARAGEVGDAVEEVKA